MSQDSARRDADIAKEAEKAVGAGDQPQRDDADPCEKSGDRVVGRPRMRRRNHHSSRPHLIKKWLEIRAEISHIDRIAARCELVFGAEQKPRPRGIEAIDPGKIESDL